jgi:hypothetical protein
MLPLGEARIIIDLEFENSTGGESTFVWTHSSTLLIKPMNLRPSRSILGTTVA